MGPLELVFVFVMSWFTVIFAVLPWGNRPDDSLDHSQSMGVPAKPRLALKALITTIIALAITVAAHLVVGSGLISFRA